MIEFAGIRREHSLPVEQIKASQAEAFAKTLKAKLPAKDSGPAKSNLNLLVDEIVVSDKTATMKGSYSALAHAAAMDEIKVGHLKQVPTSIPDWCAIRKSEPIISSYQICPVWRIIMDSNQRQLWVGKRPLVDDRLSIFPVSLWSPLRGGFR